MATLEDILARNDIHPEPDSLTDDEELFQLLINTPSIYEEAKAEGVLSPDVIDMIERARDAEPPA